MTSFRRHRLITVLFALISLLFMQLAVAQYVCPAAASNTTEGGMVMADGTPCAGAMSMAMDAEQPTLCHAHCQADKQSFDKFELPPLVAISALPANFTLSVVIPAFSGAALQAPHLMHATAPPVAIQNCCFRI